MARESDKAASAPNNGSQVLTKGLKVLTHLSKNGETGVRELARDLEIGVSVAHRLLTSLVDEKFVEKNTDSGKYRIGIQALEVGRAFLRFAKLEICAPPVLYNVAEKHRMNTFMGVMKDLNVVYLFAIQEFGSQNIRVMAGSQAPLFTTAMGRVLLSGLRDVEVVSKIEEYRAQPFATEIDSSYVIDHVQKVRSLGYDVTKDEAFPEVVAVGVPVYDFTGRIVAAISLARPTRLLDDSQINEVVDIARTAAAAISLALGQTVDS